MDIINDVSGLTDERFVKLIRDSDCAYVLTHSLGVPADPNHVVDKDLDIMSELKYWLEGKMQKLLAEGVRREQIIIDPGIGFGKNALQSQIILKRIHELYSFGCRILVAHSRKSFLSSLTDKSPQERDLETVGVSLALADRGVDILRVHNPMMHQRALQAWNHVRGYL